MKDKTGERLYSLGRIITLSIFGLCWISPPSHAADISCIHLYTGVRADGETDRVYVGDRKPIPGPEIVAELDRRWRAKYPELDFIARLYAPQIPGVVDRAGARKNWPSGGMPIPYVTCMTGQLNGPIVKGDYDRVVKLLRANHPFLIEFYLEHSPGGDVAEAVRIGRLFRQYLIKTNALDCASACALIWFGGVDRDGQVGLHRPWINDPRFRELSPTEASTAYRQILGEIETYLNDMEVPKSIIELMVTTSSGDIRWIDSRDNPAALERPPSIAEWEDASCGFKGTFSSPPWDTATMLKWYSCRERLRANGRDRITAPST